MSAVEIHLLLNHFPIVGSLIAFVLLLAGLLLKIKAVQNAGLLLLTFVALLSIPVFLTGEPSEEFIEEWPGVSHDAIEEHEDAAKPAFWCLLAAGAAAGAAFFVNRKSPTPKTAWLYAVLLLCGASFGLMARAGGSGGKIRHPELEDVQRVPLPDTMPGHEEEH